MNNDLISREALKKEFEKVYPLSTNEMGVVVNKRIYDIIDNAPSVYDNPYSDGREDGYIEGYEEAKRESERPQGEWWYETVVDGIGYWYCSNCMEQKTWVGANSNFCPNCGAKMRKAMQDEQIQ